MEELLNSLKSKDFFIKRTAIIEIAKLEELNIEDIKKLFGILKDIEKENDKALNFFLKKALKNLEKLEKLANFSEKSIEVENEIKKLKQGLKDPEISIRINTLEAIKVAKIDNKHKIEILEWFAGFSNEDEAIKAIETIESIINNTEISEKQKIEDKNNNFNNETPIKTSVKKDEEKISKIKNKRLKLLPLILSITILLFVLVILSVKLNWPFKINLNKTEKDLKKRSKLFYTAINQKDNYFLKNAFNFDETIDGKLSIIKIYAFNTNAIIILKNNKNNKLLIQKWIFKDSNWWPDKKIEYIPK